MCLLASHCSHFSLDSVSFSKNTFYDKASGSALFLIFDQVSGSCCYTIVLIKKGVFDIDLEVNSLTNNDIRSSFTRRV